MGALFKQTIVRTTAEPLRRWVQLNKIQVIGPRRRRGRPIARLAILDPAVLMLGSERKGLTDEQRGFAIE